MSDVLLIDNSILQETVLVPVTAVQPDLVTQTDVVVYVPLASKNAHGIVKIGEGLHITSDGLLSFDRSEVTIKELALNGTRLVPDENKRVNIVLHKKDVGLANVDNTSDLDKPISKATQRELSRIQGLIKGGENAVSYESYEALVNDFNILGPDVYSVGQSVFIATLKVPDLWVYGVEEEFEEFTYIDDSTIESILNIDGTFKVGYYRLAALDTLKVDLSNYVTNQVLDLKLENVAYKEDLPKEYVKIASVTDNTLTLQNQDGTEVVFESKEPDLSGYLPITGGTISRSSIAPLKIETGSTSASLIAFGNKIVQQEGEEPVETLLGYLGVSAQKEPVFNNLHSNIVLAYKQDLSSIKDITLSSDSSTLTIAKRDGSFLEFKSAADLTDVVKTTGDQTITGVKTFSNLVTTGAIETSKGDGIRFISKDDVKFMLYGDKQSNTITTQIISANGTESYYKLMDETGNLYSKKVLVATVNDVAKLGTSNWSVTQDSSDNLVFSYA